jgi:hypothetical protein
MKSICNEKEKNDILLVMSVAETQKCNHMGNHDRRMRFVVLFFCVLVFPFFFSRTAEAAGLQQVWLRLDRLAASATTGGTVCAKTAVANVTESNVVVTFPSGFTVNGTASNWTTSTTDLPSGATAWLGIGTATNVTSQAVTFPSSDLNTNTLYCFNFTGTSTLTNHATPANSYTGTVASGGNSSTFALSIISNDAIVVTATVPSTFTFSLSANADTFASPLSTTAQLSNGVTATIITNASSGWVTWVKSLNAALNSASTGATIATTGMVNDTVDALTSSTYGYLLDVTFTDSGNGTGTVSQGAGYGQEYDGNSSNSGGTLSTSFQPVASSSGTTDGDTVVLKELARVTAYQPAASDYTDTLTVVAAGRF